MSHVDHLHSAFFSALFLRENRTKKTGHACRAACVVLFATNWEGSMALEKT